MCVERERERKRNTHIYKPDTHTHTQNENLKDRHINLEKQRRRERERQKEMPCWKRNGPSALSPSGHLSVVGPGHVCRGLSTHPDHLTLESVLHTLDTCHTDCPGVMSGRKEGFLIVQCQRKTGTGGRQVYRRGQDAGGPVSWWSS